MTDLFNMDYNNIRLSAQAIIRTIGKQLIDERRTLQSTAVEVKGLNDFVTAFDKRTERLLIDELAKLLPESGFIAEEKTSSKITDDLNWIIDPIDGTTNFIHGLPIFAISVALQHRGRLVVGVVYELGADECFSASLGGGAFLNDASLLAVSDTAYSIRLTHCDWLSVQQLFKRMDTVYAVARLLDAPFAWTSPSRFCGYRSRVCCLRKIRSILRIRSQALGCRSGSSHRCRSRRICYRFLWRRFVSVGR
jgi:fructose-1,6-bisphosphatase/inositol monophosphatase family enzyme